MRKAAVVFATLLPLLFAPAVFALDVTSTSYQVFTNTLVPGVMSQTSTNFQVYAAIEPMVGEATSASYLSQSGVPIPPGSAITPTSTPPASPTPDGSGDLSAQGDRQNTTPLERVKEKPTLEFTYPTFLSVKKLSGSYPEGADRVLVNGSSDGVRLLENRRWEKDFPLFLGFNRIVVEAGFGARLSEPVIADLERLLVGDMNRSWSVDDTDLSFFTRAYGVEPLISMGDFDDGGKSDMEDLRSQFSAWGTNLNHIAPTMPSGGSVRVVLEAPKRVNVGDSFEVIVSLENAADVDTVRLNGNYDQEFLKYITAKPLGLLLDRSPDPVPAPVRPSFSFGAFSIRDRIQGNGNIAVFTFEATKAGEAEIRFTPDSRILSAGIDEARVLASVRIQIGEMVVGIPAVPEAGKTYLDVFSTTHPDSDRWYQSHALDLQWKTLGKKVRQVFVGVDPRPDGSARYEVPNDPARYTMTVEANGLWYGHVKIVFEDGTEKTATIRYQIDDEPPLDFNVLADQNMVPSRVPNILRFGTRDTISGILGYAVFVDQQLVATTTRPFAPLSVLAEGDRQIEVRAYDLAGNTTISTSSIRVVAPPAPTILPPAAAIQRSYILYLYALAGGVICFLLYFIFRNFKRRKAV